MKNNGLTNERTLRIANIAIISLGFAFLFWRVRYGYCFNDEPYMLTLAQRLAMGDKIIFDEWNMGQLFGLAVLPLVKLYLGINGSSEGILLFSRCCFCVLWFATALCVYFALRKHSKYAILCFAYFVLFAPLDYMTCSYTSFGIMGTVLLGCLLSEADNWLSSTKNAVLVGAASAVLICITVLSSPYFAAVYFAVFIALAIFCFKRSTVTRKHYVTALLTNLILVLIIGGTCFTVFSLSGHTVGEMIDRIQYVLFDPVHTDTLLSKIVDTAASVYRPMLVFYLIGFVLLALYWLRAQFKKYRLAIALYCAAVFVYSRIAIANTVIADRSFNYEMLDLALLGLAAFALLEKKPWKLLMCYVCTDILYAVCTFLASNTKLMSISAALVPCGVIGIIFILMLARELEAELPCEKKSIALVAVAFIMLCQFSLQICVRTSRQYWDYPLHELTRTIECGAAKGLVTAPEECEAYEAEYKALQELLSEAGETSGMRFVNLTDNPVVYLDANLRYGTFSSWTFGYHELLYDRFAQYYEIVPENIPQLVFYNDDREYLTELFDVQSCTEYECGEYHLLVKNS